MDGYEILNEVDRGGQAVVYRARQSSTGRTVAVKLWPRDDAANRVPHYRREFEAMQGLDHAGICTVFGLEMHHGRPALVMEWVDGVPIDQWARGLGTERDAVRPKLELFLQVCDAVSHAHQRGVLHRDLKPSNILVDADQNVRVVDFGVAKMLGDVSGDSRPSASLVGTPLYLSPESLRDGPGVIDARSDVYAMGVVLFVMLTGALPYRAGGGALADVVRAVETADPLRPSALIREIGGELDAILSMALARDPDARYQSVDSMAEDVRRYLRGEPVRAHPPGLWYRLRKTVSRHPAASGLSALALSLSVAFGFTAAIQARQLETVGLEQIRLAEQAKERAAELERVLLDYRLAVRSMELDQALEDASIFFPASPDRIEAMEAWLTNVGEPLAEALAEARIRAAEIRSHALPWTEDQRRRDREVQPRYTEVQVLARWCAVMERMREQSPSEFGSSWEQRYAACSKRLELARKTLDERHTYRFSEDRDGFLNVVLVELIGKLERFVAARSTLVLARSQLAWARIVDRISIDDHTDRWAEATNAIATHPRYGGLTLRPQRGLVPIGPDPKTELWEFAHLRSADPDNQLPLRGADGRLPVTAASGIVFVLLPGGEFWMGAQRDDPHAPNYDRQAVAQRAGEGPVHRVRLAPFFMGKTEVSQAQWRRLSLGAIPSKLRAGAKFAGVEISATHPVESIAHKFCGAVLSMHGLNLPTEAQWEYACRAGTATPWSTGNEVASLQGYANLADLTMKEMRDSTTHRFERALRDGHVLHAPVASFAPNAFGLFDMHGNVNEWCRETSAGSYRDPVQEGDGLRLFRVPSYLRLVRGGNFVSIARTARSAGRGFVAKDKRAENLGVRAMREVSP